MHRQRPWLLGVRIPHDLTKVVSCNGRRPQDLTKFSIILQTLLLNSSCDTNKKLTVDFVSPKAWFSAQNAQQSVWQLTLLPYPLAGFRGWALEGKVKERKGKRGRQGEGGKERDERGHPIFANRLLPLIKWVNHLINKWQVNIVHQLTNKATIMKFVTISSSSSSNCCYDVSTEQEPVVPTCGSWGKERHCRGC